MIELTEDKMRNRIRHSFNPAAASPSTDYAERHQHLVHLYLDYLLTNYPPQENGKEAGKSK